jgi:hypothetical protein
LADDSEIQQAVRTKRKAKIQETLRSSGTNLGKLISFTPEKDSNLDYNYDYNFGNSSVEGTLTLEDLGNTDFSQKSQSIFDTMEIQNLIDLDNPVTGMPQSASRGSGGKRKRSLRFSGAKKRGFGFSNLGKRDFDKGGKFGFNDISAAIMNGTVTWEQLMFRRDHLEYVNKNKQILLKNGGKILKR